MEQAFADFDDIVAALNDYFDGIYEGDTDKLRRAFHERAHLYSATDGEMSDMSLKEYLELVDGRPSPASQEAPRLDRIISIDMAGPEAAAVKAELAVPPKYFTDLLTLLKVDGEWRIISKIYHFVVHE